MPELETDILAILRQAHAPLRTKHIVDLLKEQGWADVYTSTVNPLLHGKLKDKVIQNGKFEWSLKQMTTEQFVQLLEKKQQSFGSVFTMARRIIIKVLSPIMPKQSWGILRPGLLKEAGIVVPELEGGGHSLMEMNQAIWSALLKNVRVALEKGTLSPIPIELLDAARARMVEIGIVDSDTTVPVRFLPQHNFFRTIKGTIQFANLLPVMTHLTDVQAAEVCSRMASGWARALARRFRSDNDANTSQTRYELHAIANKALNIYGPYILSFIATLPRLPFRNNSVEEIRSYQQVRTDFPLLSFRRQTGERVNIGFFLRRTIDQSSSREKYKPDVRVLSDTYNVLGTIDEAGRLRLKLENFRPLLSIFFAPDGPGYQLYSGVTNGVCVMCNRPLSHPDSLRIGIGPVCAKNSGFDPILYDGDVEL